MPRTTSQPPLRAPVLSSRGVRTIRAVVASGLAVFVALIFHIVGGGALPTLSAVGIALILAVPVAVLLIGRRLSSLRLTGVVAIAQAVFHTVFGLGLDLGSSSHAMHGAAAQMLAEPSAEPTMSASSLMAGGGAGGIAGGWTGEMALFHLAAVVLTVLALRVGEGAFWALVGFAIWRVEWIVAPSPQIPPAPRLSAIRHPVPLMSLRLAWSALRHRGPPIPA
jgi:hypothetical protein